MSRSVMVRLNAVKVDGRFRQDLGDLGDLTASIEKLGLLHPIVVTSDLTLVAGGRRIAACRDLGWDEIPATVADHVDDAASLLVAERDENTCRKDMTASELYELGVMLTGLERPKAAARQRQSGLANMGRESASSDGDSQTVRTSERVADGLGLSKPTWERLKHVGKKAGEGDPIAATELDAIDAGDQTITGAYNKVRQSTTTTVERRDPRRKPAAQQRGRVEQLIASGHRATQIADDLGVSVGHLRNLCHEWGITITADHVIGKSRLIDARRVVTETVAAVEGLALGLSFIDQDDIAGLDIDPEWVSSLTRSLKPLTALRNRMKELSHEQA